MGFPDFTVWLWAVALVIGLTGALRLGIIVRVLRGNDGGYRRATVRQTSRA